ncbi:MAG: hypothetical protein M3253_05700, partial [Chloroflexota bacterium]|nr:hypothetical protein [Chloroflexota bacterium]
MRDEGGRDAPSRTELGTRRPPRRGSGNHEIHGNGYRRRGSSSGGGYRLLVFLALLVIAVVGAYILLPPAFGGLARSMAEENPDFWLRVPFVSDVVTEQIEERLDEPAGTDPTPVEFMIDRGASSRQITDDLVQRGLLADRLAFSYILINEGVGGRLQAGSHTLAR